MDEASGSLDPHVPGRRAGAAAIWLMFFTLIYDAYVVSFASASYYDYVAKAPLLDSIAYTWSIIHVRNTVGLSILAFVLAAPLVFFLLCLWMLKGGRRCRARSSTSCTSGRCSL
ncbi:hypothetical protein ACOJBM_00250 [Rhizobium beringeri]